MHETLLHWHPTTLAPSGLTISAVLSLWIGFWSPHGHKRCATFYMLTLKLGIIISEVRNTSFGCDNHGEFGGSASAPSWDD